MRVLTLKKSQLFNAHAPVFFFFLNSVQFFLYVTWLAVTLSFDN